MAHNPVSEIVSTLQSVHIKDNASVEHDLNPSTAASQKLPADIVTPAARTHESSSFERHGRTYSSGSVTSASTIPSDVIRPRPRRRTLPPFPDFRFEQSYLASLKSTKSNWEVAYITFKDQVVWPLVSGMAYNLLVFGWRHWNRDVKLKGQGIGARLRRWWWRVNNWRIPAKEIRAGFADGAEEFYVDKFGSAQGD